MAPARKGSGTPRACGRRGNHTGTPLPRGPTALGSGHVQGASPPSRKAPLFLRAGLAFGGPVAGKPASCFSPGRWPGASMPLVSRSPGFAGRWRASVRATSPTRSLLGRRSCTWTARDYAAGYRLLDLLSLPARRVARVALSVSRHTRAPLTFRAVHSRTQRFVLPFGRALPASRASSFPRLEGRAC